MENINMISGFRSLMLDSRIMRALDDMEFAEPTEIQAQAIPLIRQGKDIVGTVGAGEGGV